MENRIAVGNLSAWKTLCAMTLLGLAIASICEATPALAGTTDLASSFHGAYFGQKPPGITPEPFAPEFLSSQFPFVARIAFTRDGDECYFTVADATFSHPQIYLTKLENGAWTVPAVAVFAHDLTISSEPFFSADGSKLYFTSNGDGQSATNRRDLWVTERAQEGWGDPQRLPPPINSAYSEWFFFQEANGTVYFVSNRPGGLGGTDIYRAPQESGRPAVVEDVGAPINSKDDEWDPLVLPGGRTLVFASTRPGGAGGADLYVSYDDGRGGWTAPVNTGDGFNTQAYESAPSLSPDGKYLFFARYDGKHSSLYWVAAAALERFRGH